MSMMEKLKQTELADALAGMPVGEIYCFDTIGSTNDFGFERSAAGAPDMTVITAFEQTSGRGRMQRQVGMGRRAVASDLCAGFLRSDLLLSGGFWRALT